MKRSGGKFDGGGGDNWRKNPTNVPEGRQPPATTSSPTASTAYGTPIQRSTNNDLRSDNERSRPTQRYWRETRQIHGTSSQETEGYQRNRHLLPNSSPAHGPTAKKPFHFGFKYLEQLLMHYSDEEIAMRLASQHTDLHALMRSELNWDLMILVVRAIRRATNSNSVLDCCRIVILQAALVDGFIENLERYMGMLLLQNPDEQRKFTRINRYFWRNPDGLWTDLVEICTVTLNIMPTLATLVLPRILSVIELYTPKIESHYKLTVPDEVKLRLRELSKAVEDSGKTLDQELEQVLEEDLPPKDFRNINVLPTPSEVLGDRNFLRKNVLEGSYDSVDHYLDVQFRLLREDFVRPLRQSIQSYLANPENHTEYIKIFEKVRFLHAETNTDSRADNVCMRIKFQWNNLTELRSVDFEIWRTFLYGSLLCFTSDNFKTIFFGRVINPKPEGLEKGELIVGFDDSCEMLNLERDFVMAECRVYFEPYFIILNAMKRVRQRGFPMAKYIVYVNPIVDKPRYLENQIGYVSARETSSLHFNNEQLEAYKAALTEEFVIIQGPPGTGKTYLGLEIAKTLIQKSALTDFAPILVVCYTNHALDKFLEALIPFTNGNIVRIGGSYSPISETLKPYSLKQLKTRDKSIVNNMKNILKDVMYNIEQANDLLKVLQDFSGILPFKDFDLFAVIPSTSWLANASLDDWLSWLFQENYKKGESDANFSRYTTSEKTDSNDTKDTNRKTKPLFELQLEELHIACSSDAIINCEKIGSKIEALEIELEQFVETNRDDAVVLMKNAVVAQKIRQWRNRLFLLQAKLAQMKQKDLHPVELPNVDWNDPWAMSLASRWDLYLYVVQSTRIKLPWLIDELNKRLRKVTAAYQEIKNVVDVRILRSRRVIGVTATGAASRRKYMEMLKCPIVIVEEAAAVLEAQIVVSITEHCQHLILIGDNKQLQPSTADYEVKMKYGLGVGLFERMIKNHFKCHTLNVQHRMRPEISELIRGTIYDALEDHKSVLNMPQVVGMDRCLYFIDHQENEQTSLDEGPSKRNVHEAEFLVALAKYLVFNGHAAEQITILTCYLGQLTEISNKIETHQDLLKRCRVNLVESYQGEENDLVLLSLVRSNPENKIGFLESENRICVALSRARNGFYVIGNLTQLCHESHRGSGVWSKMLTKFEQQNAIGSNLTLRCQIHDVVTQVKSADDFLQVPGGGCTQKCDVTLKCGHNCQSICHVWDRMHEEHPCMQICLKNLCDNDDTHLCKKLCYETCEPCRYPVLTKLACGHELELECHIDKDKFECPVLVPAKLPCGHTVDGKPCGGDALTFPCPHPCDTVVQPCGHVCLLNCHVRQDPDHLKYTCTRKCAKYMQGCTVKTDEHLCPLLCYQECSPCNILMIKKRTVCQHAFKVSCRENVDEKLCQKACTKVLGCGHKCDLMCGEVCGPCCVIVDKKIELCGHLEKVECHAVPDHTKCRAKCSLELPCGHLCTANCNEPCTDKCKEKKKLASGMLGACGHTITEIDCHQSPESFAVYDPDLLKNCTEPCGIVLECGHECSGTCSECFQGRFHKRCSSKCRKPLVCNHICQNTCSEACRSCVEPCPFRCIHSRCKKLCGEVCTPCKEPCPRQCRHRHCTNFCGQPCNVSPCEEPCPQLLSCGHQCPGFCGDPCLSKCKECHPEFFKLYFGSKDKPEARFVELRDCLHIVEDSGMIEWLQQTSEEIAFKVCPTCKVPIETTHRYSDYVKNAALDLIKIKMKLSGKPKENLDEAMILIDKIKLAKTRTKDDSIKKALMGVLRVRLEPVRHGQRQTIDKVQLNAVTIKFQLLQRLIKAIGTCQEPKAKKHINAIVDVITRDEDYITDQEIDDASREIDRLSKMIPFSTIDRSNQSKITTEIEEMLKRGEVLAYAPKLYSQKDDDEFATILQELKRVFSITVTPMAEKDEIVKSMGFAKGPWCKCPSGHVYTIGECEGAAIQKSICYECQAEIGGTGRWF